MNDVSRMEGSQCSRASYLLRVALGVSLLFAVWALVSLETSNGHWDGRFAQMEYRIRFYDAKGCPLSGVELRVEDEQGNRCFAYPVADYVPGRVPRSDERGLMTFHHIALGLEFGGSTAELFWLFPVGETEPPRYRCRFFHGKQELFSAGFRELDDGWGNVHGEVIREWDWLTCTVTDQDAPAGQEPALLGPELDDSTETWTIEQSAVRSARFKILGKRQELKKETGLTTEPLRFPICRVTWRGHQ